MEQAAGEGDSAKPGPGRSGQNIRRRGAKRQGQRAKYGYQKPEGLAESAHLYIAGAMCAPGGNSRAPRTVHRIARRAGLTGPVPAFGAIL